MKLADPGHNASHELPLREASYRTHHSLMDPRLASCNGFVLTQTEHGSTQLPSGFTVSSYFECSRKKRSVPCHEE
jgi:hypothetical protein